MNDHRFWLTTIDRFPMVEICFVSIQNRVICGYIDSKICHTLQTLFVDRGEHTDGASGATACLVCPAGFQCPDIAVAPVECGDGQHSPVDEVRWIELIVTR